LRHAAEAEPDATALTAITARRQRMSVLMVRI
jgi:hypothetical protein